MNPFADLLKDVVYIENNSGERQGPYKTNLSTGRATIFDKNLKIEPGYFLVQSLPDGREKKYTVTRIKQAMGMLDIPESQILEFDKDFIVSTPSQKQQPGKETTNEKAFLKMINYLIQKVETSEETQENRIIAKLKIKELVTNPVIRKIVGKDAEKLLK